MSKAEVQALIKAMLLKAPKPEAIADVKTARQFKELVKKAQSASSVEKLQPIYNQLRNFYS